MAALEYASADAVRSRIELNEDEQTDWSADEVDLLASICGQVNDYVEDRLEFPCGPSESTALLLDGNGRREIFVRIGVRTLTKLELQQYTGADWETIPLADVFLRPLEHDRQPGMPAQWICLSDHITGSYSTFLVGLSNVRPTGDFGPAEIAAALNNDPTFAATIASEIANRVRYDAPQTLTAPQQTQARSNIAAYGAAEIGNPDADLAATYTAAKA